jgi:hypothetical protein
MLKKIKIMLFLVGFGVLAGSLVVWMIYAWIEKGYAPVDTIGGNSKIGAVITSTLLIGLFGLASLGSLFGAICLCFVDFSKIEEIEAEEAESEEADLEEAEIEETDPEETDPEETED